MVFLGGVPAGAVAVGVAAAVVENDVVSAVVSCWVRVVVGVRVRLLGVLDICDVGYL